MKSLSLSFSTGSKRNETHWKKFPRKKKIDMEILEDEFASYSQQFRQDAVLLPQPKDRRLGVKLPKTIFSLRLVTG